MAESGGMGSQGGEGDIDERVEREREIWRRDEGGEGGGREIGRE